MNKVKNILSLIFNIIIVVFTGIAIYIIFSSGAEGNMVGEGFKAFRYFTILSNVFVAIISLIMIWFNIKGEIPRWMLSLKLIGTTAVTVTLLTVVCLLSLFVGFLPMITGANLYMHLLTPLVAIISYIFFDYGRVNFKVNYISIIPTFIYAVLYAIEVLVLENWPDFYGFNSNFLEGLWYVSFIMMLIFTFVFSLLLNLAHNKVNKEIE